MKRYRLAVLETAAINRSANSIKLHVMEQLYGIGSVHRSTVQKKRWFSLDIETCPNWTLCVQIKG